MNGALTAFLRRRNPAIKVFLPEGEPERSQVARELAKKLAELAIVDRVGEPDCSSGRSTMFPHENTFWRDFWRRRDL